MKRARSRLPPPRCRLLSGVRSLVCSPAIHSRLGTRSGNWKATHLRRILLSCWFFASKASPLASLISTGNANYTRQVVKCGVHIKCDPLCSRNLSPPCVQEFAGQLLTFVGLCLPLRSRIGPQSGSISQLTHCLANLQPWEM